MKVRKIVPFSLKMLRCRARAIPIYYGIYSRPFFLKASLEFGVWRLEFGAWSLALGVWRLELEFGPNAHAHACANNADTDEIPAMYGKQALFTGAFSA